MKFAVYRYSGGIGKKCNPTRATKAGKNVVLQTESRQDQEQEEHCTVGDCVDDHKGAIIRLLSGAKGTLKNSRGLRSLQQLPRCEGKQTKGNNDGRSHDEVKAVKISSRQEEPAATEDREDQRSRTPPMRAQGRQGLSFPVNSSLPEFTTTAVCVRSISPVKRRCGDRSSPLPRKSH